MHSAKVSLLIVRVPVQTERLNPERERGGGETNPARKSLSLCAAPFLPFLPLARVRVRSHGCLRDIDAILHSNAGQEASASLVLKPGIGIHRGPSRSLPPALLYSRSLSRAQKETQQK